MTDTVSTMQLTCFSNPLCPQLIALTDEAVNADDRIAANLGREPINLPGGRLARVRYTPIATKFRRAAK
jgi:hypothetical protein